MARPQYSISYNAPVHSTQDSGSAGDALIPLDTDSPYFVKSTLANRGTRRSTGIALAAYDPGKAVEIQETGLVDRAIVNLGAGDKAYVRVSSSGTLERVITPSSTDDLIGTCDTDGTITLSAGMAMWSITSGGGSIDGWYDVTDYGADPSGVVDSSDAIHAAINAMSASSGSEFTMAGVLWFPPGRYKISKDIYLFKCVRLQGSCGGDQNQTRLELAAGKSIHILNKGSPFGGDGTGASIRDLNIWCSKVDRLQWQPSTTVSQGAVRHVAETLRASKVGTDWWGINWGYLECLQAGNTSSANWHPTGYGYDKALYVRWEDVVSQYGGKVWFNQMLCLTTDGAVADPTTNSNVNFAVMYEVTTPGPISAPVTISTQPALPARLVPKLGNFDAAVVYDPMSPQDNANTWDVDGYSGTLRVVAQLVGFAPEPPASTAVKLGDYCYGTTDTNPLAANLSNLIAGRVFKCTTAGTTTGTPPTWNTTEGGTTTWGTAVFTAYNYPSSGRYTFKEPVSGGAVWAFRRADGIYMHGRGTVENCYIYNATNAGICIRAAAGVAPDQNANRFRATNCWTDRCGIGVQVTGNDANCGYFETIYAKNSGYGERGHGGISIWDDSAFGCVWNGCMVENGAVIDAGGWTNPSHVSGGGPCVYRQSGSWPSEFIGWYVEPNIATGSTGSGANDYVILPTLNDKSIRIGGTWAIIPPASSSKGKSATVLSTIQGQNLRTQFYTSAGETLYATMAQVSTEKVLGWAHSSDALWTGFSRSSSLSPAPAATDWWALGYGFPRAQHGFSVSGRAATWPSTVPLGAITGAGQVWFTRGRIFLGDWAADPASLEFRTAAPTTGHYVKGSLALNSNAAAGGPFGWRCVTSTTYSNASAGTVNAQATWEEIPNFLDRTNVAEVSRGTLTTNSVTASQVVATVPLTTPSSGQVNLYRVVASFTGGGADGRVQQTIDGAFEIDSGGTITRHGTDTSSSAKGTGTTASSTMGLDISGSSLRAVVTPASATTTTWQVILQTEKLPAIGV